MGFHQLSPTNVLSLLRDPGQDITGRRRAPWGPLREPWGWRLERHSDVTTSCVSASVAFYLWPAVHTWSRVEHKGGDRHGPKERGAHAWPVRGLETPDS